MTNTARREYAIRVENLGKRYQLGAPKSGSFRESMSRLFHRNGSSNHAEDHPVSGRSESQPASSIQSDFWALRDINFEIKRGEAVGIIGRNGAGKSTLLKILSRITEPTTGRFEVFGRVSSLLEVGTGFHPELTGRENVYLNGTILGMKRREVKAKFDEIVAFSGVEKFIDTPVKHYSSGMQVRLAFAVAAHLEPEILIIDEVLAVGDAEFQKKCLGKMEDVTGEGRTVLFVSHNMGAVKQLCDKGILIDRGRLGLVSNTGDVLDLYLAKSQNKTNQRDCLNNLPLDPDFEFLDVKLLQKGNLIDVLENGTSTEIKIQYHLKRTIDGIQVYFDLYDDQWNLLFKTLHDEDYNSLNSTLRLEKGVYESSACLPEDTLVAGSYYLTIRAAINGVRKISPSDGITFKIDVLQTGRYNRERFGSSYRGVITPNVSWKLKELSAIDYKTH